MLLSFKIGVYRRKKSLRIVGLFKGADVSLELVFRRCLEFG
jgi:hypothetical protein